MILNVWHGIQVYLISSSVGFSSRQTESVWQSCRYDLTFVVALQPSQANAARLVPVQYN